MNAGAIDCRLVRPSPSSIPALLDAVAEFGDGPMDGAGIRTDRPRPSTPTEARRVIESLLAEEDPATALPEGLVHCSYRWIVSEPSDPGGMELLGFLAIRYRLNRFLFAQGGHIGYSVRPSQRGRGIATAALRLGLAEAFALGIDPVLITCAPANTASRRVIEHAGGDPDDLGNGVHRFWIGAGPRPARPPV